MDTQQFITELLGALSQHAVFGSIAFQSEGPIANGRIFFPHHPTLFLRFYYNSHTGTLAFALVEGEQRIWGIDFDNRRGWHLHPWGNTAVHKPIKPLSVTQIIELLAGQLD